MYAIMGYYLGKFLLYLVLLFPCVVGLILVLGALFLLHRGTIALTATKDHSPSEALVAEVKELFKIRIGNPVVAIFVIGLLFVIAPLVFLATVELRPVLQIKGKVTGGVPEIGMKMVRELDVYGHPENGQFSVTQELDSAVLNIEFFSAGFSPVKRNYSPSVPRAGVLDVGALDFTGRPPIAEPHGKAFRRKPANETLGTSHGER